MTANGTNVIFQRSKIKQMASIDINNIKRISCTYSLFKELKKFFNTRLYLIEKRAF